MEKFKKDIINEFWEWVTEHQDNETVVEHDGEGNLCIWVDFNDLDDFAERYIPDVEDALQTALFNGHVCVEVKDFLNGHGFTMEDVWKQKPQSLKCDSKDTDECGCCQREDAPCDNCVRNSENTDKEDPDLEDHYFHE